MRVDDTLVRNTAEELRCISARAHQIEIALVGVAAVLMVLVAGFTGWNTHRLRAVNDNLTSLVETVEANQEAQQTYSERHGVATADSHGALAHNIACMADYFRLAAGALRDRTPLPERTVLDACFATTSGAPPAPPLPGERKRDGNER